MRTNHDFRFKSLAQSYAQPCASPEAEKCNDTDACGAAAKRDFNPSAPHPNDDPLGAPMTIREVAVLLGCSAWTVRQRHLRCGLPFLRIGTKGKLLFYRKQVVQWILQHQERR
jgi:excisionase family DNA binding protein